MEEPMICIFSSATKWCLKGGTLPVECFPPTHQICKLHPLPSASYPPVFASEKVVMISQTVECHPIYISLNGLNEVQQLLIFIKLHQKQRGKFV